MDWTPTGKWAAKVAKHQSCCMPEKCKLWRSLINLDDKVRVNQAEELPSTIRKIVTEIIEEISVRLAKVNPLFQCEILERGSSFNGLKVGRPDEFDFMLHLTKISTDYAQKRLLLPDARENKLKFTRPRAEVLGLDACHSYEDPNEFDKISDDTLDSSLLKYKFRETVKGVVQKKQLEFSEEGKKLGMYYIVPHGYLAVKIYGVPFTVQVDLTPCLQIVRDGKPCFLVPSIKYNTWQRANEDPYELSNSHVREAARVFKAVRDIVTAKPISQSKFGGTDVYAVIEEGQQSFVIYSGKSEKLMKLLNAFANRPSQGALPSFTILGAVVQSFRKNPSYPLCALLLDACRQFDYTDACGVQLLRNRMQERASHDLLEKKLLPFLFHLDEKSEVISLPPWYSITTPNFATYLTENGTLVETFSWAAAELTAGKSQTTLSSGSSTTSLDHKELEKLLQDITASEAPLASEQPTRVTSTSETNLPKHGACQVRLYQLHEKELERASGPNRMLGRVLGKNSRRNAFVAVVRKENDCFRTVVWPHWHTLSGASAQAVLADFLSQGRIQWMSAAGSV